MSQQAIRSISRVLSLILLHLVSKPSYVRYELSLNRYRPHEISLEAARYERPPLPKDLLSLATCSKDLAEVTVGFLGPYVQFLTAQSAEEKLSNWIIALGPFVRAVSLWAPNSHNNGFTSQAMNSERFNSLLRILNAVAWRNVSLTVLDLRDARLTFHSEDKQASLMDGLLRALQQNRLTLKELALPLTPVCVDTLKRVVMPALQILDVESPDFSSWPQPSHSEYSASYHERALRGLIACYGRVYGSNFGSVHTLRYTSNTVSFRFCRTLGTLCSSTTFDSIKVLKVTSCIGIDEFVAVFPGLESLYLDLAYITPQAMQSIVRSCPNINQIHLKAMELLEGISTVRETLQFADGKLRAFRVRQELSPTELNRIGESNQNLSFLETRIAPESIPSLSQMFYRSFKNLRQLTLHICDQSEQTIGIEGWRLLCDGCKNLSCLERLTIGDPWYRRTERDVEGFLNAVQQILQDMGSRAKSFRLYTPAEIYEVGELVHELCRLMRTCSVHTKNMEELVLRISVPLYEYSFEDSFQAEKSLFMNLLETRNHLISSLSQLYHLDLEEFDTLGKDVLENIEHREILGHVT
ncbi:hypothetical protein BWQ96_09915 [Gracilariopsis chorda]|uniref:Uncharacterized protein n=1 Tax=Gracilariopsis chorda TaxID=448386 RepID=A0A2V3IE78_9FLOR|nr:hypothetical protein BWQ96_09915 [Gracilariopsis chorda]|eukprot:PXF40373.1 hypothetical protein BWQ96_09915 [Gracilariopsis chorda]